jgi:ribosome-associated protein
MKNNLFINNSLSIPEDELIITTSRSGGAGGQHVNKTDTRITIRWNIPTTQVLTQEQKNYMLQKLHHRLTIDGDLIIHNSESRSQQQNKKNALRNLAQEVRNALHVAKKRVPTGIPKGVKEARLKDKLQRSFIKKMRNKFD